MMSILTRAMQTARDAANPGACTLWLASDDGSGSTFTDKIGGVVMTKGQAGAVDWDIPHTADWGVASAAPTSGTIPAPTTQSVLVLHGIIRTANSFFAVQIGTDTKILADFGKATFSTPGGGSNAVTTSISAVGVANQPCLVSAVLTGNTLYHLTSVNGGAITENGTADATAFRALHPSTFFIENTMTTCSTAFIQDIYGIALFSYTDNNAPSLATIKTGLAEIEANWKKGHKYLPSSLTLV